MLSLGTTQAIVIAMLANTSYSLVLNAELTNELRMPGCWKNPNARSLLTQTVPAVALIPRI